MHRGPQIQRTDKATLALERVVFSDRVARLQKNDTAAKRDVVPAPQEPTPSRARRPDDANLSAPVSPQAADAGLAKVHELEIRLQVLEKQMLMQVFSRHVNTLQLRRMPYNQHSVSSF